MKKMEYERMAASGVYTQRNKFKIRISKDIIIGFNNSEATLC